jgi:hypothetical protein
MPEFFEQTTKILELRGGKRSVRGKKQGTHRGERVVGHCRVLDDYFTRDVLSKLSWCLDGRGYLITTVRRSDGTRTTKKLHQVVYEHYHGPVPPGLEIDHKDRDKLNSVPTNLRAVTHSVNIANTGKQSNNTSGYKRVSWDKKSGKWHAKIEVKGKQVNLGRFTDKIEAARAVNRAYERYFPEIEIPNPEAEERDS